MSNRRNFIKKTSIGVAGTFLSSKVSSTNFSKKNQNSMTGLPIIISTWKHGYAANEKAYELIKNGKSAIDAVEQGVKVTEADPDCTSVGYGGWPDRDGNVTLDACIMDHTGNCGSVSFLKNIKHPISVARKVMDDTPHVMLSGEGAFEFAIKNGFHKEDLLTEKAKIRWKEWLRDSKYKPIINVENHDTIGLLAIDKKGDISGACTTSGLAWKMHGRVGDSPIIGAGMFVDNEIGGCCATGVGEAVMKEACEEGVSRIVKNQNYKDMQIGYLAINKEGEHGAFAVHKGFDYALHQNGTNKMIDAQAFVK